MRIIASRIQNSSIFATTALVAFSGAAVADIDLEGNAQMGIQGGSGATTQFVQDIDITFKLSGTADNGLSFGTEIDLSEDPGAVGTNDGGIAIFVSGDFGRLTMGDTDGALDWAMQEVNYNGAGSINGNHDGHRGYNGNSGLDGIYDGQILRYDHAFGDFKFAISVEMDDNTAPTGGFTWLDGTVVIVPGANNPGVTTDPIWGIGATYGGEFAGGTFGVGIGYQFSNDIATNPGNQGVSVLGLSGHVALESGLSAAVNYSVFDTDGDQGVHWGIGASYEFDAITLHANYGQYDWDVASGLADASGYGLSAEYDFGGGLAAQFGYGYGEVGPGTGASSWSFGLNMKF
ncbi:porin [Roseicyclus sp.]|uniref:porin n=1 Tax=Roseicyclus sp. TaxID=1914329 RepID=UPI003F9F160D